jgi:translation initiation factor 1
MSMRKPGAGGLVYSTEGGRMCPTCRQPLDACLCKAKAGNVGKGDGIVRVSREGRAGKTVTVIRGVPLHAAELADLGKHIRVACGSGGTLKSGVLEVQGDHVERVLQMLRAQGWAVKRAGG